VGRVSAGDAALAPARARRGRKPRVRSRARRFRHVHRAVHVRQPPDLHRDHVQPTRLGARRGGGVRRDSDGRERGGPRAGSQTMTRMGILMAVAFVDMIGLTLVLPLLALYALHLHASPTTIGFLTASFPVAQLVASPIWGRVSDRYGRRPALLVGLAASAVAYLIFGLASSLWLLFLSRFVQGLGGGTTGVAQAYVADTMAPNERAKALGWLSAATSLGVLIGPVVGSVAFRAGQSAPGLVAAALCAGNFIFAWRWLPESRRGSHVATPSGRHAPPPERPVSEAVWDVIRHPSRPAAHLIWIYAVAM